MNESWICPVVVKIVETRTGQGWWLVVWSASRMSGCQDLETSEAGSSRSHCRQPWGHLTEYFLGISFICLQKAEFMKPLFHFPA